MSRVRVIKKRYKYVKYIAIFTGGLITSNIKSRLIKQGALCLILVITVALALYALPMQSDDSYAAGTGSYEISGIGTYDNLASAFDAVNGETGSTFTITANNNDFGATSFVLNAGKNVILTSSAGNVFKLTITTVARHGTVNGNLTLENIILDGNKTAGGVVVNALGTFTMNSGAVIQNCSAETFGGAVYSKGTFIMNDGSAISGNEIKVLLGTSQGGGAGVYNSRGTFTMESGAVISNNITTTPTPTGTETTSCPGGGGVYNYYGTFIMNDGSAIIGNVVNMLKGAMQSGGAGVYNYYGKFTMEGATISNNITTTPSGITLTHYPGGGGVYNHSGTFTMKGSSIVRDNVADLYGGGVFSGGGTFNMSDNAAIYGNSLYNKGSACGGGVANIMGGIFNMSGKATISGNKATFYGGGVFNWYDKSIFNMSEDAAIYDNKVVTSGMYGGGVTNHTATFNMSGGVIYRNEATYGGGTFNIDGTFNMYGNAEVRNNNATSRAGGVYNNTYDGTSDPSLMAIFNMYGNAAIYGNTISSGDSLGGGVYNGTRSGKDAFFNMSGNAAIYGNILVAKDSHGGGVYNSTSATFSMSAGEISGNKAYLGGGIYNYRGILSISGGSIICNTATGNDVIGAGGGIYTTNFAKLTVSDGVVFSGNIAPTLRTEDIIESADADGNTVPDLTDYNKIGNVTLSALSKPGLNAPAYNNFDINYPGKGHIIFIDIEADGTGAVAVIGSHSGKVYRTLTADGYVYVPGAVSSITLAATPRCGYEFKQFTVDGILKGSADSITISINGNMSVIAEFEPLPTVVPPEEEHNYFITATSDSGSVITPKGVVEVHHDETQTFNFSAMQGYKLEVVYVDGKAISSAEMASGEYTFTHVINNHTIRVVSEAKHVEKDNIGGGGGGGNTGDSGSGEDVEEGNGQWAVLNLVCAILAVFTGIIAVIAGRDRFRKNNEEKRSKTAMTFRVLALIIGLVSIIIFFLTEDWNLPVVPMDKWTLLMFILFLATLVLTMVSFRYDEAPEEDEGEDRAEI